jgi:hypothetical protein
MLAGGQDDAFAGISRTMPTCVACADGLRMAWNFRCLRRTTMTAFQELPDETSDFAELRSGKYIYVDKTQYIVDMLSKKRKVFIVRPRRFGKTLMLSTLENIFRGNHELFKGLAIYPHLDNPLFQQRPVIRLDMSYPKTTDSPYDLDPSHIEEGIAPLKSCLLGMLNRIADEHDVKIAQTSHHEAFADLIYKVSSKHDRVVILIDEYDKLLTETFDLPVYQNTIHKFLRDFYSNIKIFSDKIYVAYITGISKFSKLGVVSFLNNVTDFSNNPNFCDMFGYTEKELRKYYEPYINKTATKMKMAPELLIDKLKSYYDGYSFCGEESVYNPISIHNFFVNEEFKDYWIKTGSQKFIEKYIHQKNVTVEEFEHVKIEIEQLEEPGEITPDIEPALFLYQAGYLTQRKQVGENGNIGYYLTYPNNEVRAAMIRLTRRNFYSSFKEKDRDMIEFEKCLKNEDYVGMLHVINNVFSKIVYDDYATLYKVKDEIPLECFYGNSIYFLMYFAQLDVDVEPRGGVGRADIFLRNNKNEILFELKISKPGTGANIKTKFCEAIEQMNKYISFHENPVPIRLVVNGKIRRIVLASINDEVFKLTPQSGKTPATCTRIGAIKDFAKPDDVENGHRQPVMN